MNQRVLVIDDSEDIHELLALGLHGEPIELAFALDGEIGMAMCRKQPPDLILLDVDMPAPDGYEVCRALKADSSLSSIPIVFLTGASSTLEKVRGLHLGAVDYVTKPFEPAELSARVSAALRTKYLMDLLSQRAMIDGLTGLLNRAHFDSRILAEVSLAQRNEGNFSCLMVDVDHFKSVNDTFGHAAGDFILRKVGQVLLSTCRIEDVVCRYGGEEFGILSPNTAMADATILANRLLTAIADMANNFQSNAIHVTCSIGTADLLHAGEKGIVQAADQALYRAKHLGRNRVECAQNAQIAA